jgi:putative ABC transport system permease protein
VLFRFPALFVALALGAFLVAVAAASYPLFISASQSELLASGIAEPLVTPYGMGVMYRSTNVEFTDPGPKDEGILFRRRDTAFAQEAAQSPILGPAIMQMLGPVVDLTMPGGRTPASGPVLGRMFSGPDAVDHVTVLERSDIPGIWITDVMAEAMEINPGDRIELGVNGRTRAMPVAGVYRTLYTESRLGYWRPWFLDIVPNCPSYDCPVPPQPILMDPHRLIDVATDLHRPAASFAWQAPVRTDPPLTLDEARGLAAFTARLKERMSAPDGQLGALFECCGTVFRQGSCVAFFCRHSNVTFTGGAEQVIHEVDERITSIQGPMFVLTIAGLAIALAVVGAAAVFVMASRRVETGVLSARGWGGTAVGGKAVLEALIPCVIGAAVGLAVATVVVASFGPDGPVADSARVTSVVATGIAMGVALGLVGVVSAIAFLAGHEHRHHVVRWLAFVPWELLAFGAAWAMSSKLGARTTNVTGEAIQRPAAAVFVFPLLLAFGAGVIAARLMALALAISFRRRAPDTGASAWWLATRRLRSSGRLPQLLLVAGSLALVVFVSSQALVSSLRSTVEAKAKVFVGSDVQVHVGPDSELPGDDYPFPVTKVTRSRDAGTITGTDATFDLLAVDPRTLSSAAYWNDAFSDDGLDELANRLDTGDPGVSLPIVLSNGDGFEPVSLDLAGATVPVTVVGRATSFPGTSSGAHPLVVVSYGSLAEAFADRNDPLNTSMASTEFWIRGAAGPIVASIDRLGVLPLLVVTADEVEDIPYINAAIQTFVMLDVLGVVAMILLVVVALVYLQARQRSRVIAGELSQRMGQERTTMRRALILELGAVLLASLAVGAIVGGLAARVVVSHLDPLPTIPPSPLLVQPVIAIVVGALAVAIAAVVGGRLADRAERRTPLGEVLRVAE